MYLTPERFRTMGFGADLSDLEDVQLRSAIYRASAAVDAYCAVPLLPQKHDFRGGTITDETHEWLADQYERGPKPLRFWPWHQPIKEVTSIRIYSTPSVYTEIEPDEIFINNSAGYIEVSSLKLTQYGVFGAGVITALIGMWNPQIVVSYTYGREFAISGEILEPTDALTYRAQNQWWVTGAIIRKNGVTQSSGITIDTDEGTVLFDTPLAATDVVTADYSYRLPHEISQATGILAAEDLGESGMRSRGMSGVDALTVGEITIRRSAGPGQRGGTLVANSVPASAQALLDGFRFLTAR